VRRVKGGSRTLAASNQFLSRLLTIYARQWPCCGWGWCGKLEIFQRMRPIIERKETDPETPLRQVDLRSCRTIPGSNSSQKPARRLLDGPQACSGSLRCASCHWDLFEPDRGSDNPTRGPQSDGPLRDHKRTGAVGQRVRDLSRSTSSNEQVLGAMVDDGCLDKRWQVRGRRLGGKI